MAGRLKVNAIKFIPVHNMYPQNLYFSQDENFFFSTLDEIDNLEEELNKIIDFASKNKIETCSYEFLNGIPNFYKNIKTRFRCLAGYIFCEVDSLGNFYPCYGLGEKAGNIIENKFTEIWKSEKFNHQRKMVINCHNCWASCYVEPRLRFSLKYQIKNFLKTIKEYRQFLC